jgi:iron complex outermembrane receptor protein
MIVRNAASAATVAFCLFSTAAGAQGTMAGSADQAAPSPPPAPAAAPVAQPRNEADIIVTAQRRSQSLMSVPISITAISAEALNATGAKNLVELEGVAPGIYFSGNTGYSVSPIAIRGTSGTGNALGDEPVAVYIDGVFQNAQTISTNDLADIRSIEIVRGPQGTLQGRNSTAGALLIRTQDPENRLGGYIRTSVADPAEYRAQAALTVPLGRDLAGRVSLGYADELGWAHNTFTGTRAGSQSSTSARGVLLWTPGHARVRLSVGYSTSTSSVAIQRYAQTIVNPTGQAVIVGVNATPQIPLPPAQLDSILHGYNTPLNVVPLSRVRTPYAALEASYNFGGVELISITGLSHLIIQGQSDSDGLALTDRQGFNVNRITYTTFSEELRLQSQGDRQLSWIIGSYFSHIRGLQNIRLYNLTFTAPRNQYLLSIANQDNDTLAGFADATFRIVPTLLVTGGIRFTHETKDFTRLSGFYNSANDALYPFLPNGTYAPPKATFNNVSYRAKLTFQPSADALFYLSYGNGFKSGGFNALGNDPVFQPETLRSAEAGIKLTMLDRHFVVTASAFHNIYSNLQVTAGIPAGGVAIYNAARARIDGGEVEAHLRFGAHFSVDGNVAYTDSRFSSFPRAVGVLGNIVDATGNQLPRSPKWQYFIQPNLSFDLSPDWAMTAQASYRWRSRVFFFATDQNVQTLQGPSFGEFGARLSIANRPLDLTVSVFATNLNNARVVNNEQSLFNYPVASFNKPRSIGIQIEKRF